MGQERAWAAGALHWAALRCTCAALRSPHLKPPTQRQHVRTIASRNAHTHTHSPHTCAPSTGFLFTCTIRAVEWDVSASPSQPDGRVFTFEQRGLTPSSLKASIAKSNGLEGPEQVGGCRLVGAVGGGA